MSAIELAKAYVQIVPSADGITDSIASVLDPEAAKAGQSAGEQISGGLLSGISTAASVGVAAIGAVAAAGVAATGALVSGVGGIAEYGDNIDKMSQKMGLSVEAYQEWDAVMQHSGTSMEAMKASMKTLANAAESGSEAFDALGISQEAIANMSQEQLFEATIAALQNVEDETTRTYLAGKTLGRGATELGALLNTSAEDTQAMRDRVRELGGVMSTDAVKAAAAYQDSLQDMKTAFSGISRGMLQEFLPSIRTVMDGLTEIFSGNSEQGIGMVTEGIQTMLDGIGEMLPQMAEIATSIIAAIAETLIANLPMIVEAGIGIIGTLAGSLLDSLPTVIEAVVGVGDTIITTIASYGPEALNQGLEMLINLASGILDGLPQAITSMGSIMANVLDYILRHMPEYMQKGVEILGNLASGIARNLPAILSAIGTVLARLISTIAANLPSILSKGVEILASLASGIIRGIPKAIATIPQLFSQFFSGFSSCDWGSLGGNLINGIVNGITGAAGRLASAAVNAVSAAWHGMTSWLDIRSPSHKAENIIGKNWALGIGVGFEKNFPTMQMEASTARAMDAIDTAASAGSAKTQVAAAGRQQKIVIEVPLVVNDRKIAKAIGEAMYDELGRLTVRKARLQGKVVEA